MISGEPLDIIALAGISWIIILCVVLVTLLIIGLWNKDDEG